MMIRVMGVQEFDPDFDPARRLDEQLAPYSAYVEQVIQEALAAGYPVDVTFPDGGVMTLSLDEAGEMVGMPSPADPDPVAEWPVTEEETTHG